MMQVWTMFLHPYSYQSPYLWERPSQKQRLAGQFGVWSSCKSTLETTPAHSCKAEGGFSSFKTGGNFINGCWFKRTPVNLLNCWCVSTNPSSRMGNFTSQLPTMFWILKSRNLAGKPSFCTTRAYFLAANRDSSSLERETQKATQTFK